jgi:hypothetical protein
MHNDTVFFKAGSIVGVLIKVFFMPFQTMIQVTSLSSWALTFGLHMIELVAAGLITGYFGMMGKKFYEKQFGKFSDKES